MSSQFASGKIAIAMCDVCGFQYKLKTLRPLTVNLRVTNIMACRACWVPDQPQLQIGRYPINDPQALRNPRPDSTYRVSGVLADGELGGGSRVFSWGWAPVGGGNSAVSDTPNPLAISVEVGTVTVAVT